MIFSSPEFIFLLLPLAFFGYFFLNRLRLIIAGKVYLVFISLIFYSYWNVAYLPLLLSSILVNFALGTALDPNHKINRIRISRNWVLIFGIGVNLILLGYFKYSAFFMESFDQLIGTRHIVPPILLPLGISFFTFTQIAYLVDSYKGEAKEYDLVNYCLFVTFFPHLIAGPILHHREMMSQFESRWTLAIRYRNILTGLFIFSLGLFKKVSIADTFAIWANQGFDQQAPLDFFSAWATSLSYTFQLYFDFSGYCDMAIGASLLFNIWLPINFNSPYKALDIQDFWHRWHMTLSRYLRDYLYIPLGGNRCSEPRVYFNLFMTFLLGGLWHGASWMFVIWGALHGAAMVVNRIWKKSGFTLPNALAWFVTFNFINLTWIFFRSKTMSDALRVLNGLIDINTVVNQPIINIPTQKLAWGGWLFDYFLKVMPTGLVANILAFGGIILAFIIIQKRNSNELIEFKAVSNSKLLGAVGLFCIAMYSTMISKSSVFLYFNF